MRYIHKTLLDDEQIIYMTHPHWIVYVPSVCCIIITLLFALFGDYWPGMHLHIAGFSFFWILLGGLSCVSLIAWLKAFILHRCSEFGVTNKRVLIKMGWIQRDVLEIFLDKIEAIHVDQTIIGRLLGYGALVIVGTGGSKDPYPNVPRPLHFRKVVQQSIDDYVESHFRRRNRA